MCLGTSILSRKNRPAVVLLACVLVVAAALRCYRLTVNPPELFADELDLYVSMHSIVTTGHDIDGTLQPFLYCLLTRNTPMYAFAEFFSTSIFGNGALGIRLPAVIFGLVSIVLLYGVTLEMTKRKRIALFAALCLALLPEHIHFSRIAWEPSSELPFILGGFYALLRAFRSDAPLRFEWLSGGALLLGAACYTYMGAWFYALLLGGALIALQLPRYRTPIERAKILGASALWAAVSAPALWLIFTDPHTSYRVGIIGTFNSGLTPAALGIFARNYLSHFSWSFLFSQGADDMRQLRGIGEFSLWMAPLVILGCVYAGKYVRETRTQLWLWIWLFAYPLGGSLTNDGFPHAARTLAGMPVFCVLSAIGYAALCDFGRLFSSKRFRRLYRWSVRAAFAVSIVMSLVSFCTFYFVRYPHISAKAWESGTRATFELTRDNASHYARICFGGFNFWHIDTLVRYYLQDVSTEKIENSEDARCFLPGTLLVSVGNVVQRPGARVFAGVPDENGMPFAYLEAL